MVQLHSVKEYKKHCVYQKRTCVLIRFWLAKKNILRCITVLICTKYLFLLCQDLGTSDLAMKKHGINTLAEFAGLRCLYTSYTSRKLL